MEKDQSEDLELDGPITLSFFDGIARDFTQGKWKIQWKTVKCGDFTLSCCPATLTEKRAIKKIIASLRLFWN